MRCKHVDISEIDNGIVKTHETKGNSGKDKQKAEILHGHPL